MPALSSPTITNKTKNRFFFMASPHQSLRVELTPVSQKVVEKLSR
jgi:hypothetical protein